jgi:cytochrome P450
MSRARRRDRRVYLAGHPILFALLAAARGGAAARLGGTLLVHGTDAYVEALTRVPLDRTAHGTTGGAARELPPGGRLFDQAGGDHRAARRDAARDLGAAGVDRLRPGWQTVLDRRLAPLATGGRVDLVEVAAELAGVTTVALLGAKCDPVALAGAARSAAAAAARDHLPGPRRPGSRAAARAAADRLAALLPATGSGSLPAARGSSTAGSPAGGSSTGSSSTDGSSTDGSGRAAMLAVAAVNTTVAGIPRAVAWCADANLWGHAAADRLDALVDELLRVVAPSPLLPRVAAEAGTVDGRPVRRGDRLVLVARHAAQAHRRDPDPTDPAPAAVAQLVFGAGPHACPGARLARAQLADVLRALAPYRPVVVRARADRRSALPGWASLVIRAGTVAGDPRSTDSPG